MKTDRNVSQLGRASARFIRRPWWAWKLLSLLAWLRRVVEKYGKCD